MKWGSLTLEKARVIRFLNTNSVKTGGIHYQLEEIYCENKMTDGIVRKLARQFNDR